MKMMTKELQALFESVGSQDGSEDPVVIAKYFNPTGSETWWCTEYDSKSRILYGYVTGMFENEWGYTSLDELMSLQVGFGLGIERDLYFKPTPIKKALKDYYGKEIL